MSQFNEMNINEFMTQKPSQISSDFDRKKHKKKNRFLQKKSSTAILHHKTKAHLLLPELGVLRHQGVRLRSELRLEAKFS